MKKLFFIALLTGVFIQPLLAEHIKGGEMFYEYLGPGNTSNTARYMITLKLYIDCNANNPGQLDNSINVTIFDKSNGAQVLGSPFNAPFTGENFIRFDPASNPCIGNPPSDVCYRLRFFSVEVTLPVNTAGYTAAYQRCCRIQNIINLTSPSNNVGATYWCEIPGTGVVANAYTNSSPRFQTNDASAICRGSQFTLSFMADEPDNTDSLVYQFCSGFIGGSMGTPAPSIASSPPYSELSYQPPFNGGSPLGNLVSIDSKTGLISGVAPGIVGQYVITVCAYEYRQGKLINIHRKDIHVKVSDCVPLKALLDPDYAYCDDFLVNFKNKQLNPTGSIYIWQYGDGTKADTTTDIEGKIQHQFADTGTYQVKLKVILAGQCIDSTTTLAKVYPGFYPGFVATGSCLFTAIQFQDTTKSRYGVPNKWRWDFGDGTTLDDTSLLKNPSWKYADTGIKKVQLIVESSKGCKDTVYKDIPIKDKPTITLPFRDTLICSNPPSIQDTLQLHASGFGVFSWTPANNILNSDTPDPLVWPTSTTTYHVQLNESGCINNDSVTVRVVSFVTMDAGPDSTICLTDTIQLHPAGNGLRFEWVSSPLSPINDSTLKQPLVSPVAPVTDFQLTAHIGKCSTTDNLSIFTIPYPQAIAGPDTTICFEDTATLNASMVASSFTWSPTGTLSSPGSLNTLAYPLSTTPYVLTVRDVLGCPKPGRDTVIVNVLPRIFAFAGNDTSVVIGQPLQLNGTGAALFEWQPAIYLNQHDIFNPVALPDDNITYVMKAYTMEGCFDLDTINIKLFKTSPDIFVPNAFRPGASRNNVLRPIPVGISKLDFFRVFNRWGQLVYQTFSAEKGWDGTLGGKLQSTGTYVWMVQGTDYTGKVVFKKGTAILIR